MMHAKVWEERQFLDDVEEFLHGLPLEFLEDHEERNQLENEWSMKFIVRILSSYQWLFSHSINNLLSFLPSENWRVSPNFVVNPVEDEREYHWFDVHLIRQRIQYRYHYVHNNDNARTKDSRSEIISVDLLKYLFQRVLAYQIHWLYYRVHLNIRHSDHLHHYFLRF